MVCSKHLTHTPSPAPFFANLHKELTTIGNYKTYNSWIMYSRFNAVDLMTCQECQADTLRAMIKLANLLVKLGVVPNGDKY